MHSDAKDEEVLDNLACSLMCELVEVLEGNVPDTAQIVVRPLPEFVNGELVIWVVVNWPN